MTGISIIIPTYNRSWCIEKAVKSVLEQTFKKWELIIVDDGSTDDTKIILHRYLEDERIKYIYKKNGGVGSARNVGIRNSKGKYVTFLDSDDSFSLRNALYIMYKDIKDTDDIVAGIAYPVQTNSYAKKAEKCGLIPLNTKEFFSIGKIYSGEKIFIFKRETFQNLFFIEYVNGMEGIIWSKILKRKKILFHNIPIRNYYIHEESLSNNNKVRSFEENLKIIKAIKEFIQINREELFSDKNTTAGQTYYSLANHYLQNNSKLTSLSFSLKAINNRYITFNSLVILLMFPFGRNGIKFLSKVKLFLNQKLNF